MTQSDDRSILPWSHRLSPVLRGLVTVVAGILCGIVGTFAHRMGASANIPYGLVLAFLILGISAWCARSRLDVVGLALHLIASSGTIWLIAVQSTDDALTPVGFSGSSVPFFPQRVGYLWLIGCIVVQLMLMFLPARWFAITPKTDGKTDDKTDDKNSQQPSQLSVSQQTPDTLAESR